MTLELAQEIMLTDAASATFLDLNSASPGTKRLLPLRAGGYYVEAGDAPVPPYGIAVPALLAANRRYGYGPVAAVGFNLTPVSPKIGWRRRPSMSRSIMIKGLAALVIRASPPPAAMAEADARYAARNLPIDWDKHRALTFSRAVQHGKRRAEEMGAEAATTVKECRFCTHHDRTGIAGKHDRRRPSPAKACSTASARTHLPAGLCGSLTKLAGSVGAVAGGGYGTCFPGDLHQLTQQTWTLRFTVIAAAATGILIAVLRVF